jgi:hypothetical protein
MRAHLGAQPGVEPRLSTLPDVAGGFAACSTQTGW